MTINWRQWFGNMARVNPKLSDKIDEKQITSFWENEYQAFKARLIAEGAVFAKPVLLSATKAMPCPYCHRTDFHHIQCSIGEKQ